MPVLEELALGKQPAIREQQRRDEQQEKDVGLDAKVVEARKVGQCDAAGDQENRQWNRDPLAERRHRGDGEQQSKRDFDETHERMVAQRRGVQEGVA